MLQEGVGDGYWVAMGEYCPQMEINGITDNLEYIERHFDEELARQKSAEIFKLLLLSTRKLRGKVRYRKNSLYESPIVDAVKNNFSTKFDTSRVSVMYVDEIKGIEFDRVYVVDEDMERNERYIAFTRALDKLTIVHS